MYLFNEKQAKTLTYSIFAAAHFLNDVHPFLMRKYATIMATNPKLVWLKKNL